jgi:hypothetical protein
VFSGALVFAGAMLSCAAIRTTHIINITAMPMNLFACTLMDVSLIKSA